jgi:leader peptidase (prepilin peptidase)/N-methyltransferase
LALPFINNLPGYVPLTILLCFTFALGAIVGSLLNVCIYRIPMEKSILWPGSRCGRCFQPIRWYDNLPLLSYWILRGRCRTCGARFSIRYWFVELLTGAAFAGLFYLVVIENVHDMIALRDQRERIEWQLFPTWQAWIVFGHHALLVSLLIVASCCDLDHREIPLAVTVPGTVMGLIVATIWAWPWPYTPLTALGKIPPGMSWSDIDVNLGPRQGLYAWPFWGPLPPWFAPGGNWQTGLATGLAGLVMGTVMLRIIRFLFGLGMGLEALGLGDADLMMMAGAFLGWQPTVAAFFIGVFAGLIFGVIQIVRGGDNLLPFGPALAVGIVVSCLCWHKIGPNFQPIFFHGTFLLILSGVGCVLMLFLSYVMRMLRLLRR